MSVVVGEIPDGTATVIVALIGAAQAAIIALIARQSSRQKKVERDVREITYQTRNSHQINLRDLHQMRGKLDQHLEWSRKHFSDLP